MRNEAPGARWLEIAPARLAGWLASFGERHGPVTGALDAGRAVATCRAADGSVAECHIPFPPLPPGVADTGGLGTGSPNDVAGLIAAHAVTERTIGVLLVRLGGYAAGVFAGPDQRLIASKVGSRLVHGRSAAGGQSQRRFARRREKQATEALTAAADTAAAVFGRSGRPLDALV